MTQVVARNLSKLAFTKMHGAGNDFVILDGREPFTIELSALAVAACRPHFGIGADGLIVVQNSTKADFGMLYFNADGGETICGNGMRCVARFIYQNKFLTNGKSAFSLETENGIVQVEVFDEGRRVKINMGKPTFEGLEVPVAEPGNHINSSLEVDGEKFEFTAVGIGNPHCVIFVDDFSKIDLPRIGPKIEHHPFFPKRTNVEFIKMENKRLGKMIVWERGVGETYACGTGIAASFAAAVKTGRAESQAQFKSKGGDFDLTFDAAKNEVWLLGPAEVVFTGEFDYKNLLAQNKALNNL